MKPVQFVDLQWNVNYEDRDDFMRNFYSPIKLETESNPQYKKNVYIVVADELGIPYYWEIGKLINKLTGGKLQSKIYKPKVMIGKISEALERRELFLNDEGEIEGLKKHLEKAIGDTGYLA